MVPWLWVFEEKMVMVEPHGRNILHFLVDVKLQKRRGLSWLSSFFPFGWFCPHSGKLPFPPCDAVGKRLRDKTRGVLQPSLRGFSSQPGSRFTIFTFLLLLLNQHLSGTGI